MQPRLRPLVNALLIALVTFGAHAADFTVDDILDAPDGTPGDGVCDDGTGACTLRAALEEIAALTEATNSIDFDLPLPATIQLTLGQLVVTDAGTLSLTGPGRDSLTILGGDSDVPTAGLCARVFRIGGGGFLDLNEQITISGLTLAGGLVEDGCVGDDSGGAGVLNETRDTVLEDCRIEDNVADGTQGGGGVHNDSSRDLFIRRCEILNNSADNSNRGGGGIYNAGDLYLEDVTLDGNHADVSEPGAVSAGGALYATSAFVEAQRTTFSNNRSHNGRGGGAIFATSVEVLLVNCTVSGNRADDVELGGGAIVSEESEVRLFNCTVTDNHTSLDTLTLGDPACAGGGVWSGESSEPLYYENTILIGNFSNGSSTAFDSDCCAEHEEALESGGYNVLGIGTGCIADADECILDEECDDGDPCNGFEGCTGGFCVAASSPCSSPTPACDRISSMTFTCFNCVAEGGDTACDDGKFCNGAETCNPDGSCSAGTPPDCAPGYCDSGAGACSPCSFNFQCRDDSFCNGVELCDTDTGACGPATSTPCDEPGEVCNEVIGECLPDVQKDKRLPGTTGLIEPLADNGGPTMTHALPEGSMAIDMGDPLGCTYSPDNEDLLPIEIDQRYEPRPVDGDGDGTKICDIGAYETESEDQCPDDPLKTEPGACGCGLVDSILCGSFAISTEFSEWVGWSTYLYPANVYLMPGGVPSATQLFGWFSPQSLGLDAIDVLADGSLLFSVIQGGFVHHSGGLIHLDPRNVYRLDPAGGISEVLDWAAYGIDLPGLDALDKVGIQTENGYLEAYAFSTETSTFLNLPDGYLQIWPQNVYLFVPATGSLTLLYDLRSFNLEELIGLDVLLDGRVAFTTATSHWLWLPFYTYYTWPNAIYIYDPVAGVVVQVFDGFAADIDTIDGFTMGIGVEPEPALADTPPPPTVQERHHAGPGDRNIEPSGSAWP